MQYKNLTKIVMNALDDLKARDIAIIDVRNKSSVTDVMIVASGTSSTHVKAMAELVATYAKAAGIMPLGTEGIKDGEWALIDLNDVVVNIMLPKMRDYYQLERLWGESSPPAESMA
jgi:ribosome-associated protein